MKLGMHVEDGAAAAPRASNAAPAPPLATAGQRFWRRFCLFAVKVFYRRVEIAGAERIPRDGPLLLCANHVNALVDAIVVQAACPRPIHPLARSGLFRRPLLRPILALIQAVPVYRRRPQGDDASKAEVAARNTASFQRLFDYLREGRTLLIFPEGQSHSDPSLRPIKTGAARIALGAWRNHGALPRIVPIGLIFTHKGRFRGDVLVQVGEPVVLSPDPAELEVSEASAAPAAPANSPVRDENAPDERALDERLLVDRWTDAIRDGLFAVTLNVEAWEDVVLLSLVQRFAAFRAARERHAGQSRDEGDDSSLAHRYRAFRRLYAMQRWLRVRYPMRVAKLREQLRRFERLCRRYGVQDYHLNLRYRPTLVLRFVLRSVLFAVLVFPLALWGLINSAVPYALTRELSKRMARGRDQYDTASMLFGLVLFGFFWSVQTVAVWQWWGTRIAFLYALGLPLTTAVALMVGRERRRIVEDVRVFLLFLRQRRIRDYLHARRSEVETELAQMARLARDADGQAAIEVRKAG